LLLSELANHVYSFEPIRFSFRMLRMNTRKCQNVTLYDSAVSNLDGKLTLNLPVGEQCPYVASTKKILGYEYRGQQSAKTVKLDDLVFPMKPTSLVVDCEGHEAEVLDGARTLLPKLRNIIVETHTLSDGSETLPVVKSILSEHSDIFEIDTSFVDKERQSWILAKSLLQRRSAHARNDSPLNLWRPSQLLKPSQQRLKLKGIKTTSLPSSLFA
ncbi:MAG: FkbM family methyltransferase, partial [Nitrososphaerales archaeon]